MILCVGLTVFYFWLGIGAQKAVSSNHKYGKAPAVIGIAFWPILLLVVSFIDIDEG